MLEDVGVQIAGVGELIRGGSGRFKTHQLNVEAIFLFWPLFFAASATSCFAPLIPPDFNVFRIAARFWSQPAGSRPASTTAAAVRKHQFHCYHPISP